MSTIFSRARKLAVVISLAWFSAWMLRVTPTTSQVSAPARIAIAIITSSSEKPRVRLIASISLPSSSRSPKSCGMSTLPLMTSTRPVSGCTTSE